MLKEKKGSEGSNPFWWLCDGSDSEDDWKVSIGCVLSASHTVVASGMHTEQLK